MDESNQRNEAAGIHSGVANKRQAQGTGVGSYFKRQELALTDSHWQVVDFYLLLVFWVLDLLFYQLNILSLFSDQIIQVVPSSQNGQFFAWVVVNGTMHKIPINVPRVFYLNSKAPVTEELPGRLVNKSLPHGHHRYNLIEVYFCN